MTYWEKGRKIWPAYEAREESYMTDEARMIHKIQLAAIRAEIAERKEKESIDNMSSCTTPVMDVEVRDIENVRVREVITQTTVLTEEEWAEIVRKGEDEIDTKHQEIFDILADNEDDHAKLRKIVYSLPRGIIIGGEYPGDEGLYVLAKTWMKTDSQALVYMKERVESE